MLLLEYLVDVIQEGGYLKGFAQNGSDSQFLQLFGNLIGDVSRNADRTKPGLQLFQSPQEADAVQLRHVQISDDH